MARSASKVVSIIDASIKLPPRLTLISARFQGICERCKAPIRVREKIWYRPEFVAHKRCVPRSEIEKFFLTPTRRKMIKFIQKV